MPQNNILDQEHEISLLDILLFLKRSWKIITAFGAVGLIVAVIYLLTIPKQYQAIAQIQMARINFQSNIFPLGVNIEEPSMLILRISNPAFFTPSAIAACSLDGKDNAASILSKLIKLSQPKVVANILELKIVGDDPESAHQCANAIFELIKKSQDNILSPYVDEAKISIANYEARYAKARDMMLKKDISESLTVISSMFALDEIRYSLEQINVLKNIVTSNINMTARLVTPIYVSDVPASTNKRATLTLGLLVGLFSGLLIAFGRQIIPRIKSQLASITQSE
jgi:capsular polysaccharide biosynthesis protein